MNDAAEQRRRSSQPIPASAGIGLRAPHVGELLRERPALGWLEVHSENYFHDGGPHLEALSALRAHYPVSVHGVGLSLGSADGVDRRHLTRLRRLVDWLAPSLVSEHLAWGALDGEHLNDLLPLPYIDEALACIVDAIAEVQDALGRRILVENVSSYYQFACSAMPEWDFLNEVSRRSGCGILLDVNNVYVSSRNHGFDPITYIESIDPRCVEEIHLAGHSVQAFGGHCVLVDTHSCRVCPAVWCLYRYALRHVGSVPVLIEWDSDLPPLGVLIDEARLAGSLMEGAYAIAA